MAILQQIIGKYTSYLGWYGECGVTQPSHTFELKSNENIHAVYKTTGGDATAYAGSSPAWIQPPHVLHLVPGNSYWITLVPGDGVVEIENFTISDAEYDVTDPTSPTMTSNCSGVFPETTPSPSPSPTPTCQNRLVISRKQYDPTKGYTYDHPKARLEYCLDGVCTQEFNINSSSNTHTCWNFQHNPTDWIRVDSIPSTYTYEIKNVTDGNMCTLWVKVTSLATECVHASTPTRTVKVPVILLGWDTGNSDTSLHFNSSELRFQNGVMRYAKKQDLENLLNGEHYTWPLSNQTDVPTGSVSAAYSAMFHGQLKIKFEILPAGNSSNPDSNELNDYAYLIDDDYRNWGNHGTTFNPTDQIGNVYRPKLPSIMQHVSDNLKNQGINYKDDFEFWNFPCFLQAGFSASQIYSQYRHNYVWAHKSGFYHGGRLYIYQMNPFLYPLAENPTELQTIMSPGVICHETGHVFGPRDLYNSSSGRGIGNAGLMSTSRGYHYYSSAYRTWYAGRGDNPTSVMSWTKWKIQQRFELETNVVDITSTTTNIEVSPMLDENKLYRINHPSVDEQWWVEYHDSNAIGYNGLNLDIKLPESGLVILHQTKGKDVPVNTYTNTGPPAGNGVKTGYRPNNRRGESAWFISQEQRDGKFDRIAGQAEYNNDVYTEGDEFSPHTIPSSVSTTGIPSGIKIHNIRKTDDLKMTFDVTFLDEPDHKIVSVDYSNSSNPWESLDSTTRAFISNDGMPFKVTITTTGIADGTHIQMSVRPGYQDHTLSGTIYSDKCEIALDYDNFWQYTRRSNAGYPNFIHYRVDPDSNYGEAFAWNDFVTIT